MRVVIKKPGKDPKIADIPNTLKCLQQAVCGNFQTFPSCYQGVAIIVNEEGKLRGMKPNFQMFGELLVGPAIFVGTNMDEFVDLETYKAVMIREDFKKIEPQLPKEAEYFSRDRNASMAKYWIPVEKGLPDPTEEDDVLVTFSGTYGHSTYDHCTGIGDYFGKGEWDISGMAGAENIEVLAWMPLPENYKEAEK